MYVIIDNYDSFTYNIYQYLSELTSIPVQVYRNDEITIKDLQAMEMAGLIISPGPGQPKDAGISIEAIREFAGKVPIFGVCLGHQAIAEAFEGNIVQAKEIVHGFTEKVSHDKSGLFRNIPSPCAFTRYHSLAVEESTLPKELIVTARAEDGEIMGIRHATLPIEGVQFHPESVASEQGKRLLKNFLNYRRESLDTSSLIKKITAGEDLSKDEASLFMEELTEGELSPAKIAAILIGISTKGPSASEIAGCAAVLRKKCLPIYIEGDSLDTCGTGGSGLGSFNISSMSAIIASACGAKVAKHGNRAASSLSGSADFYQRLGVSIDLSPAQAEFMYKETGFAFLFAPLYHKAMKYAAPVRKELGLKTIMNLVGPLSNPARAAYQIIGVYDKNICLEVAKAAHLLGTKRVMTVCSDDGLDEISIAAPTTIFMIKEDGVVHEERFDPSSLGLPSYKTSDMVGGDAAHNAALAEKIVVGEAPRALTEACLINAGAALLVSGKAESIKEGYEMAKEALQSGKIASQLKKIQDLGKAMMNQKKGCA